MPLRHACAPCVSRPPPASVRPPTRPLKHGLGTRWLWPSLFGFRFPLQAQVVPFVIRWIAVDVLDFTFGPAPGHPHEREFFLPVRLPVNFDVPMTIRTDGPSAGSSFAIVAHG